MIDFPKKNNSEIIANYIINKIISLAISNSLSKKTDNNIPNNCFEFVRETLNNFLGSHYILYDKDEQRGENNVFINKNNKSFFKSDIEKIDKELSNINENNNNNISFDNKTGDETNIFSNYFFNNYYKGDNDWNLIKEPETLNLDRYSSTLITFRETNKNIDGGKYKMNHEGILEVDENDENNNSKNEKTQSDKEKEKEKEKEIMKKNRRRFSLIKNKEKKQKLNEIANQFECYDLEPEENNTQLEIKIINKLRAQIEKEKKNKDLEKKIINEEKEKLINIQKKNEEINKKYIGKKITKDHNGEIIFIKKIRPEKLKQDFIFGKTKLKTINNSVKKKNIKKEQNKNVEKNSIDNQDEKDAENSLIKTSKKSSIKSLPKIPATKTKLSLALATIETHDKNEDNKSLSSKKRFPIITGGSNFNLMNMEIGVSLKEDEKYKTGGLDFFSKFKKFSLKAYDKKLKEAEASNSLKKNIEIIEEPKSQTVDEIANLYPTNITMGYSTSYGHNNFSSIQTDSNNIINKNLNNRMYSTNNSSMFNQYLKNVNYSNFKENNKKNNTFNPFIQLTMGSSSLIGSLDKLNLVSNEEEKNHKKRKNIFRETRMNILRKENKIFLNDINLFTKNLMTNKKIETKVEEKINNLKSGARNPEKPNIREIIQEIGLKGKILRNRSKVLVPFKSNFLDNENFFKQ